MNRKDPKDEEIDFGEETINEENERRIEQLADSISILKSSAQHLHNKLVDDGNNLNSMQDQMDDLFSFLDGTREKLKRLFTQMGGNHLLGLVIGGFIILLIVYILVFKLN